MTMFEKLADVIITINKAVHAVVEWAARIDWTPLLDGRVHRAFVTRAAEVAIARDDLSDAERGKISKDLERFHTYFDEIIQSGEKCDKQTVLRVIENVLFIGMAAGLSPTKLAAARQRIKKEQSIAAARAPRPGAISPFNSFMSEYLSRKANASTEEVMRAMLDDDRFMQSDDDQKIELVDHSKKSLKISGFGSALSKVRNKLQKK